MTPCLQKLELYFSLKIFTKLGNVMFLEKNTENIGKYQRSHLIYSMSWVHLCKNISDIMQWIMFSEKQQL